MTPPTIEFPFADVAAALKAQANELAESVNYMEVTALQVGLSKAATEHAIRSARRRAALLAYAHRAFVSLLPVESTMRDVIEAGEMR